jgi:EmrB/QacA subfamily drug resistance transporter
MIDSKRKWWILSVAAAGVLLSTIDASIVNIALPTIGEQFHTSVQTTAWVTISYLLVITASLLVFGKLSDLFGQKLIFLSGLSVFTIGSGLCAVSQGITQIIIFRLIQGIGASMIVSNTSAIVTNAFPPEQRGASLGTIGAVVSIGLMSGPPLGGMIIALLGWHYIFLVNVPIGILAIIFTIKILPEHKADKSGELFHPLDSVLWMVGITIFVMVVSIPGRAGAAIWELPTYLILCAAILFVFFRRQARASQPLLNPYFMKNDIFLFASIAGFFSYMAMIALTFMLPFLFEYTFNMTPLHTGNILVAIPATTVVMSPLSGLLSDKFGQRSIASIGVIISTTAITLMLLIQQATPVWELVLFLVLFGIGLGMFGSPNNSALMGSVENKDRGAAGGILATVRNLGMVTGLGAISLIFNAGVKRSSDLGEALSYLKAFKGAILFVIAFSVVSLIFSAMRRSVKNDKR